MHRLFITAIVWFGLVLSACGESVEIPVTPTNLNQHKYVFSLSTNAAPDGVAFHVTITAKTGGVPFDSTVGLSMVTHTKDGGHSVRGVTSAARVVAKNDKRVWEADFTVSHQFLRKSGLYFVFMEIAHVTIDGKSVAMPSADIYEMRLQDFLKP